MLKKSLFALAFLASTPVVAHAGNAQDCSFISDNDKRFFCRAQATNNKSDCSFIRDHDNQWLCKATVSRSTSDCSFIADSDKQQYCRATVR